MTDKRWIVREQDSQRAVSLARVLGISPIVASLLIARGCTEEIPARAFLHPSYDSAAAISFELARQLSALEPFGAGNPRPVFLTRNI